MKAIVYRKYGSTDELRLEEVEKPVPKDNEVLIRIHAAAVNPWDWDLVTGKPRIYRLMFGLLKPKYNIIGSDIAGTVEAIGKNIKKYKPGDEVFGDISGNGFGAFAEYACTPEKLIAPKSKDMTFEEAAAIPQAGILALQGLRFNDGIKPGQKVLLNGAGGGGGTFAIQMVKNRGAEVTCVDKSEKFELLRSLGADHLIDYTKEDFTRTGQQYDYILDVIAKRSARDYKRALKPNGVYVIVGGAVSTFLNVLTTGWLITRNSKQKIVLLAHKPNPEDLNYLNELFEKGKLKPVIDKKYQLRETPEAIQHVGKGNAKGKVVITIGDL